MSFRPIRIEFTLDGAGIYHDPVEPMHLDALLYWVLIGFKSRCGVPGRDEEPTEISMPFKRWRIGGAWGWHASALFPVGQTMGPAQRGHGCPSRPYTASLSLYSPDLPSVRR